MTVNVVVMIVMWHSVEFQKDLMKSSSNKTANNDQGRYKEKSVAIQDRDLGVMMDNSMKPILFSSSQRSKSTLGITRKG